MRRNMMFALIVGSAATMLSLPASAQATRTWVSGQNGDDAFACSRTAPCKTFAGALSKTAVNGEINCVDAGGYGAVTITKSVTIDCTGTYASILAGGLVGTNGVIVNIMPSADDPHRSVRLRGLSINGPGPNGTHTGIDGIRILQATSVYVEDVVIAEFTQQGVKVAAGEAVKVTLDNVLIRNIDGNGVQFSTMAGQVVAGLNNVRINNASTGVAAAGLTRVDLLDVKLLNNTTGIKASGTDNIVNVDNAKISFGTTGVQSASGSTVRMSNSMITQNVTGLNANGGQIISMAGNSVTGNTSDGTFTGTVGKL